MLRKEFAIGDAKLTVIAHGHWIEEHGAVPDLRAMYTTFVGASDAAAN